MKNNKKTPGVVFYGKVRIPTIGHKKAIETAQGIAKKVGGRLHIGLSGTSHPLTPKLKKAHAEALFNHPVDTGDEHSKNLFSYLGHINQQHDDIHLVAGSDRAPEYRETIQRWNGKPDKSGKVAFNFKNWKVHEVEGERSEVNKHPTQMSRDELERSVSATKLEGLARGGDYEGFRAYHPGMPEKHVKNVFNQIRGAPAEAPKPKSVKQIKEDALDNIGDLNHEKFGPMLDTFVQFASKKLGIKSMPQMQLSKQEMTRSFGGYQPQNQSIVVVSKNRHPMDIFRTVAHELVHHKQKEEGRIGKDISNEGATGSPQENEANAEAGKLMRWFAKANPEMFKSSYVTENVITEGLYDPARHTAVFMAGGPGSGKDFILQRTLSQHGLTELNSDKAFEHLMKKDGLDPKMPESEERPRNKARGRAKNIYDEKQRLAIANRQGLIVNGTADDPEKIAGIKGRLEGLGYKTMMIYLNTNNKVSKERNIERGQMGQREVPENIRQEKWNRSQKAKPVYQDMFGGENFVHVDNSEDLRKVPPERAAEIDAAHHGIFKQVRKFVSAPPDTPAANEWRQNEMKRRGITQDAQQPRAFNMTTPVHQSSRIVSEDGSLSLKNWFDKSKSKDGKKGWVQVGGRYSGEPCARQEGQTSTPKCRSSSEAASMTKKEKEYAFKKKQREDPNQPEKGGAAKPTMVKTYKHQEESIQMTKKTLQEIKDACYSKVKSRYKVWPSAYASGALVKCRKAGASNWGNKSKVDEAFETFAEEAHRKDTYKREWGTTSLSDMYKKDTPGQEGTVSKRKKLAQEQDDGGIAMGGASLTRGVLPVTDGIGPETTNFRPMTVSGYGGITESVRKWAENPVTQQRFIGKYGNLAEQKLNEAVAKLSQTFEPFSLGSKSINQIRENVYLPAGQDSAASYGKGPTDTMSPIGVQNKDSVSEDSLTAKKRYRVKNKLAEAKADGFDSKWSQIQRGFRGVESGSPQGDYTTPKPKGMAGSASGGYGFTNATWQRNLRLQGRHDDLRKYSSAYKAPPEVQTDVMKTMTRNNYISRGGDDNPEALRQTVNIHYTGNPDGKMSTKQLKSNRGFNSQNYWDKFQRNMNTPADDGRSKATPASTQPSNDTNNARPTPPQRPSNLGSQPKPKEPVKDISSAADTDTHNVSKGQTLSGIAKTSNLSLNDLTKLNPEISDPNKIYIGQKVRIRQQQSAAEPETTNEGSEAWQRKEGKNPEGGLNKKGIASYRAANPGSKLSLAVTTEPSKLKPGSKAANRRKSFCARMGGMKKRLTSAKTSNDPDSRINKSLRKWNCEE